MAEVSMITDEMVEAACAKDPKMLPIDARGGRWSPHYDPKWPSDFSVVEQRMARALVRMILEIVAPMIAEAEKIRAYKAGELFTLGQVSDLVAKARNKALDEAARVAEHPTDKPALCREDIAADILALKSNVEKQ